MNSGAFRPTLVLLGALLATAQAGYGPAPFSLNLQPASGKMILSWPATMETPDLGIMYPAYTVERSTDLEHWQPVGSELRGLRGGSVP
jgi:hypothetical protein